MVATDIDAYRRRLNNEEVTKADRIIGERARLLRVKQRLSQKILAAKATVSRNTLRDFERGKGTTELPTKKRIAAALGTTLEDLESLEQGESVKPSPLLDELSFEDLLVARGYHHSLTSNRHRILTILQEDEADRRHRTRAPATAPALTSNAYPTPEAI